MSEALTPMPRRDDAPENNGGPDTRRMGADISQQTARGAAAITQQHRSVQERAAESGTAVVALPNGELGLLSDYVDQEFLYQEHRSMFASADRFIAEPEPGWLYVWAAKLGRRGEANAHTVAAIRSGKYIPVPPSDLREDCDLPIEQTKIAGKAVACMLDVALFKVSPEWQRRLYRWRENQAVMRTQRVAAFEELKERVEHISGGKVSVDYEERNG